MLISLAVHGDPQSSRSAHSALSFAQASAAQGHQIYRVFFYHDGVRIAGSGERERPDVSSLLAGWLELKALHQLELSICVSAADRRGLAESGAANPEARGEIHAEFDVVGLGQLIDAIICSERFITFPA